VPAARHAALAELLRPRYARADLHAVEDLLLRAGTLDFPALESGLFPAVPRAVASTGDSGYGQVWVRDNVHVAHAHAVGGRRAVAARCVRALARFFARSAPRFRAVIEGRADPADPRGRPHVRFDGVRLAELPEAWCHAQNDALGAFLWILCRMLRSGALPREEGDAGLLARFAAYLEAIRYWEDEDSGHWEEVRKLSASSVGAVVAGLEELASLVEAWGAPPPGAPELEPAALRRLAGRGRATLAAILPAECVQQGGGRERRHDAALLFLVQPFDVLAPPVAARVVDETLAALEGEHGIRRYLGDSYWAPDYERSLARERGTDDHDRTAAWRDALARPGGEAQWCLFDPVVSAYFGRRHRSTGDERDLERQTLHFNRALGQLTGEGSPHGELRCPEAYYLRGGRYVPNRQTPLLWTQANLWIALEGMFASAGGRRTA